MIPLFVDLETEWRGGQSQALLLLKGLYERGHAAELIAVKGSALGRRARREGIYVHSVNSRHEAPSRCGALFAPFFPMDESSWFTSTNRMR